MKTIPLTQGKTAVIDDVDWELVRDSKWCAQRTKSGRYYAVRYVGHGAERKRQSLHVAIMGVNQGTEVDHIDGDGLNCQRNNLRWATRSQNQCNRTLSPLNTSGAKGVTFRKKVAKWQALINVAGKQKSLGYFSDLSEAAAAYDAAARKYHGEYARLNYPNYGELAA